jgi:hypothetical protein
LGEGHPAAARREKAAAQRIQTLRFMKTSDLELRKSGMLPFLNVSEIL